MPRVSIIIPTNRPADVIAPCLIALAQQRGAPGFEVILAYNGVADAPHWPPGHWPFDLVVLQLDQGHIGAAKNAALDQARGEFILLLNDDVVPTPALIAEHVAAHEGLDRPGMVLGEATWRHYADETIFDRLIQTSSMIFFYDQMQAGRWYGFRHAWNLNLSLTAELLDGRRFDERLGPFFFEDVELAHRLEGEADAGVWYHPPARVVHDHRYTLHSYLCREHALGQAAVRLWQASPACFEAVYGGPLDDDYLDYARRYVQVEGRRAGLARQQLENVVTQPTAALGRDPQLTRGLIQSLYWAHLPLKRLAFCRGLLEAAETALPAPASAALLSEVQPLA